MNATSASVQRQSPIGELDPAAQAAIEALVSQNRTNSARTQQLALDASRIVSASQSRLERQLGAGFFKRFVSAISGSTTKDGLSNQVDMLQMQRIAWYYLQQLQEQSLITAQGIAVIRNNLETMGDYLIETRRFIEVAVDKIDSRLRHVEKSARFGSWALNIEANMRRFKSLPREWLFVELTYDFLRAHGDISMAPWDVNHLVVTLEKLGVDCDQEIRLLDFIIALVDQMEICGIDRYRNRVALATDGHLIGSNFIQENVSAIGFNALHYLSDQYPRINAIVADAELCATDEVRAKLISKIFGDEFDGLSTIYSLRDLIGEIIGGSLIAIDLYRERNGLVSQSISPVGEAPGEAAYLASDFPDIRAHTYLESIPEVEDRREYVRLLLACMESPSELSSQGNEFIRQLAKKAGGIEFAGQVMVAGAEGPVSQDEHVARLKRLLTDSNGKYAWILDALFLLTLERRQIESPHMARIIRALDPEHFKEQLSNIRVVLEANEPDRLLDAGEGLSRVTKAWANVLRYRQLGFGDYFAEVIRSLEGVAMPIFGLQAELNKLDLKAIDYQYFSDPLDLGEDGFVVKVQAVAAKKAVAAGRAALVDSLNAARAKVRNFLSSKGGALREANRLVSRFRFPTFDFIDEIGFVDLDLDNGPANNDWGEQFEHALRGVKRTMDSFESACDDARSQLELFADGDFSRSIAEERAVRIEQERRRRQGEEVGRRSVPIETEAGRKLLTIQWRDLTDLPFDPESIEEIKTDGAAWLIATSEGGYYISSDRLSWEQVYPFGQEARRAGRIARVAGLWILTSGREGFRYSHDGRSWRKSQYPGAGGDYFISPTDDITQVDGGWIWRFTRRRSYQHIEKGLIFDSTRESSYGESVFFQASELEGEWCKWEAAPSVAEGVLVDAVRSIPGSEMLLAFCSWDFGFARLRKKTRTESFVLYYSMGKGWRRCTWPSQPIVWSDPLVTMMGDRIMCFVSNELMTSDKGYEWSPASHAVPASDVFHLEDFSVFCARGDGRVLFISQDGSDFKEMILEDGAWRYFGANDRGALGVYSPNRHETYLRAGEYVLD